MAYITMEYSEKKTDRGANNYEGTLVFRGRGWSTNAAKRFKTANAANDLQAAIAYAQGLGEDVQTSSTIDHFTVYNPAYTWDTDLLGDDILRKIGESAPAPAPDVIANTLGMRFSAAATDVHDLEAAVEALGDLPAQDEYGDVLNAFARLLNRLDAIAKDPTCRITT